jgi:pimeloyl-ACP methyl ester carboxylesterase
VLDTAMPTRLVPPGSVEDFLPYEGGAVRVLRGGSGTGIPVVLVHGGGIDNAAICWYEVFGPLGQGHEVLAFDLPGFGATEGLPVLGSPDEIADQVISIVRASGIYRAVFTGHSLGGDVALHLALRHAEAVAGLVLVAPSGLEDLKRTRGQQLSAWSGSHLPDSLREPLDRSRGLAIRRYARRRVYDRASVPPAVLRELIREARRPDGAIGDARYTRATTGLTRMRNDLLPDVFRITAPTLFLHGDNDLLTDPQISVAAAELMPNAEVVLIGQCGHWVQLEAPDVFLSEVGPFLDRIH